MAEDAPGETRVEIVRALFDAFNRRDFSSISRWVDPDVEMRVREGTLHGIVHFERFARSQFEQFAEVHMQVEEVFEVDDDTVVAGLSVGRRASEGADALHAWPANVFRFRGERIIFFEGFPRQEDAFERLGIEHRPVHDRHREAGTAIQVRGLERMYAGGIRAVAGIDLDVDDGEIYAFLGPNGAGKTTTVRMLTTLLRPTGGTARVAGYDVVSQAQQVRRSIGVALQEAALDALMTGVELIELQATMHGIERGEARRRGKDLLARVGLSEAGNRRVGTYSGGMRRRLDLAMALVHGPRVLFLDEPTTGLDPQSRRAIWDEVRTLNREGTTVFLTTQYLEEADQLADRVGIIHRGCMAAEGTPAALKANIGRSYLELSAGGNGGRSASDVLARFGEVMAGDNDTMRIALASGASDIAPIVRALDDAGMVVESLKLVEPSLDDVFLATTGARLEGEEQDEEEE